MSPRAGRPSASRFFVQHLRQRGHDPSAGGGKGVSGGKGGTVDVELGAVDLAECAIQAQPGTAESSSSQAAKRTEDRASEGFVDFEEVDVLERQPWRASSRGTAKARAP